jgi:hypothetical protein
MNRLPRTEYALVLRTDFQDDAAWRGLCANIQTPHGLFLANVSCVSDREYEGVTIDEIVAAEGEDSPHTYLFVVDRAALASPATAVLVVDLFDEPGRTFRVIPSQLGSVENNLSLGNMDFRDFVDACGPDQVFRGF